MTSFLYIIFVAEANFEMEHVYFNFFETGNIILLLLLSPSLWFSLYVEIIFQKIVLFPFCLLALSSKEYVIRSLQCLSFYVGTPTHL